MIVNRTFSQQNNSNQELEPPQPLSQFFSRATVIALGDPGAGKTTSFQQAAEQEPNSLYSTVRDFLTLGLGRFRGKTLYLDALDEMRGRTEDGISVLDKLRSRLDELGCPRFRLSCRAADWYGSSDVIDLSSVSPDKTVTVLQIEALGEAEIAAIVSSKGVEATEFIAEARNRDVYELLENPQTLFMLLDVVGQGQWPITRAELFQRSTEILVQEANVQHRRASRLSFATDELLLAAGHLSTVILCGGVEGIALDDSVVDGSFIPILAFGGTRDVFAEAARRRVFRANGAERVVPLHRTVAEYLAAKYLCVRIRDGLPLNRVLALITGYDGGTLAEMRGVFAWLACICLEHAEALITIDPLGVVLYGDVSLLPLSDRRFLIDRLVAVANENPWFRAGNWASRPFGALSSSDMETTFRDILADPDQHSVAKSCVIDAIRYGHALPALGDLLIGIVRDDSCHGFLRSDALEAFVRTCSDRCNDLNTLLNDIHDGRVEDKNCELRAELLRNLYPQTVRPEDVIKYLVEEPESYFGKYSEFLGHDLIAATHLDVIPVLLDTIAAQDTEIDRLTRHAWREFVGELLHNGLLHFGESITPERLYNWLGVSLDRHDTVFLEEKHSRSIREWLMAHPERVREVFAYWLSATPPEKLNSNIYRLLERFYRIEWPESFGYWMISLAAVNEDDRVALFLFREGVRNLIYRNQLGSATLEELYRFADEQPRFREVLQKEMYYEISDWLWEHTLNAVERRQKQESVRNENLRWVLEHKEQVRSGIHYGGLNFLAMIYFGLFSEVDRNLNPRERITSITNAECADAGLEGFVAALTQHPDAPTVAMIAESAAQSCQYNYGFIVLAGMELLYERSMDEMLALPERVLSTAIAYHCAMGEGKDREWVTVLLRAKPDLAAEVFNYLWKAQLTSKCEHISGLYALTHQEYMAEVARRVALPLLTDFPNCSKGHLKDLLEAAIVHGKHDELLILARRILSRANLVKGHQRVLWYAVAFLLSPEEFEQKLEYYCSGDPSRLAVLFSLLVPPRCDDSAPRMPVMPLSSILCLISIGGRVFPPKSWTDSGNYSSESNTVRGLIDRISTYVTDEATQALKRLSTQRSLLPWREALAHALDVQLRKRRETLFQYPSFSQVVNTLAGGAPANISDLQALTVEHLRRLSDDISNGSTDGFKAFWNVDSYGRPQAPRPEETCRDHFLDRLRERLLPLGLAAEPEGHYARDKRADIKVLFRSTLNLPVEIKRHYHTDLWTAPIDQLKKLYARDPGTGGRGVYLVFWFGLCKGRRLPNPPLGIQKPSTPEQLEEALRKVIPMQDHALIEIIVVDCSGR